jgi:hypothetical protein
MLPAPNRYEGIREPSNLRFFGREQTSVALSSFVTKGPQRRPKLFRPSIDLPDIGAKGANCKGRAKNRLSQGEARA